MKTVTILSSQEADLLLTWAKSQEFQQEFFGERKTSRLEKWWGFKAELGFSSTKLKESQNIVSEPLLCFWRNQLMPEADSILLYKYEVGATIGEHTDKDCFEPTVTLINLVDSPPNLFGDREPTRFRHNRQTYNLKHGEVVTFNSRVLHSVPPVRTVRYSLQFRCISF